MGKIIKLQEAYQIYILSYGNKEILQNYAESLNIKLDTFLELLLNYINKTKSRSIYANIFDKLEVLDLNDSKLIINFLESLNYSFKQLKNNVNEYILLYRPDMLFNDELVTDLQKKLEIYQNYLIEQKKVNIYTTSTSYYNQIIKSFIESNYSLKRFGFQNNIKTTELKNIMKKIKTIEPDLYNQAIESLNLKDKIKEETIANDVYNILAKIKELGNNFSIIDFLSLTNYSFEEIIQTSDKILNPEDVRIMRINLSDFKSIVNYSNANIQQIFNDKLVLNIDGNLIEMSSEDKSNVINYLKENDIPISTHSYRDASIRYYNNTLLANHSK